MALMVRGRTVIRRQLRRSQVLAFFKKLPPCLVGMEACATSHYWAREIAVFGHEVRMMPARYVKPYVKRNKNDGAEYAVRPDQDARAAGGPDGAPNARAVCAPAHARDCLLALRDRLALVKRQILEADRRILAWHRAGEISRRQGATGAHLQDRQPLSQIAARGRRHTLPRAALRANTTDRTDGSTDQHCITVKKSLANREPSTDG